MARRSNARLERLAWIAGLGLAGLVAAGCAGRGAAAGPATAGPQAEAVGPSIRVGAGPGPARSASAERPALVRAVVDATGLRVELVGLSRCRRPIAGPPSEFESYAQAGCRQRPWPAPLRVTVVDEGGDVELGALPLRAGAAELGFDQVDAALRRAGAPGLWRARAIRLFAGALEVTFELEPWRAALQASHARSVEAGWADPALAEALR